MPTVPNANANNNSQVSSPSPVEENDDWLTIDDDFMVPPNPLLAEGENESETENAENSLVGENTESLKNAEEEQKRLEEERLKKEAEEKRIAEEQKAAELAAQKAEEERKATELAQKEFDDKVRARRLEEERRAAEEKRLAEAELAKKAEEERQKALEKKAEEERIRLSKQAAERAEKERIEAQKRAEEARRAEEAKRAEEARQAQIAAQKAEEEKKAAEQRRALEIAQAQKEIEQRKNAEIEAQKAAQEKIVNTQSENTQNLPIITDNLPTLSVSEQIVDRTPSRTVNVSLNQYLDVLYPGAGWTYLGEIDDAKNLVSFSNRSLQNSDTNFTLRALRPGYTVLHFYKQDVLTNTYIDDYLEVIVKPDVYSGNQHAVAPSYAEIVPPNQRKYVVENPASLTPVVMPTDNLRTATSATTSPVAVDEITSNANAVSQKNQPKTENVASIPQIEEKKAEGTSVSKTLQPSETVTNANSSNARNNSTNVNVSNAQVAKVNNTSSTSAGEEFIKNLSNMNANELLEAAKKSYTLKAYNEALEYLNMFFTKSTDNFDEAWYLRGQLFEAPNSNFQNVKTALESYQTLVERYPSSTLWKDANKRITYINRFYFKIH